jgi:hypothetical protein
MPTCCESCWVVCAHDFPPDRHARIWIAAGVTDMPYVVLSRTLDKAQRKYVFAQTGLDTLRIRNDQIDFNLRMRRVKACNQFRQKIHSERRACPDCQASGAQPCQLPQLPLYSICKRKDLFRVT